jgi:AraC-like DNA-binding protein
VETVVVRRPPDLAGGVELWSVKGSSRLWTVFHTTYAFCTADRLQGRHSWRYRGNTYDLGLSSTMLLEPGEVHVTTEVAVPADFHLLLVTPAAVEKHLAEQGGSAQGRHFDTGQLDDAAVVAQFQRLWRSIEGPLTDPLEQRYLLGRYLAMVFERAGELEPRASAKGCARAIKRTRELLEENYGERITLDDLARETGLSKYHLERSFHLRMGLPIHQYLKKVRVARALALLRTGRRPAEIATVVGFSDQPHMTRVFREELGFTPRHYWAARGD